MQPCMALLVEGRKFLFHADTSAENQRWYLLLVSKNAELQLKKKMKLQSTHGRALDVPYDMRRGTCSLTHGILQLQTKHLIQP